MWYWRQRAALDLTPYTHISRWMTRIEARRVSCPAPDQREGALLQKFSSAAFTSSGRFTLNSSGPNIRQQSGPAGLGDATNHSGFELLSHIGTRDKRCLRCRPETALGRLICASRRAASGASFHRGCG